ncbi:SMP-30/gluconolactonase/LRE family protein [Flagellimonas allohymeniacidonis]|uniref:SMP-30/Gluconolactonase/LRE-like region domain-containing protein n=1 Tax=Flagellimonas allohymeniacidonis TaxID=2517819 RepID=A0A4Q8QAR9_9FLAO|nr:SMP-30/gluconolactonase/LRE family protein [Allomuricauda hymeniacidonis]TAI47422.1 hypothetical protein EW142_12175 [Allomuricauda hymeniacidonis]
MASINRLTSKSLWHILLLLTLLLLTQSHAQSEFNSLELDVENDLIPEGIVIDAKSQTVFINSLRRNKIVCFDLDGNNPEDFISQNQYSYLPGFGMEIKGDTLFALGNSLSKTNNKSILLLMKSSTRKLIDSYNLDSPDLIYLNDLAVDSKGKIYITNSEGNTIYYLNRNEGQLAVFYQNDQIKYSNGICISPNGRFLYLASYTSGIRILDLETKELVNPPNAHKGIDGMKFYRNSLICMVNGRRDSSQNGVYQFHLNKDGNDIVGSEKIHEFFEASDIPTTFAIYRDTMYFIADSQLHNLNQETNEIIDVDKLKNYQLVKKRLSIKPKNN